MQVRPRAEWVKRPFCPSHLVSFHNSEAHCTEVTESVSFVGILVHLFAPEELANAEVIS